eukprot:CAMPEP_0171075502 /NCGR_PEP_ID=MMETSP0766_2-20121228/12814_1 /TAXON_ID=439317 /ORGANISM="Gambierdiscus australes, Strain CAWD 149" /LENGTH=173 /DNA_ID=CAMNT_0011532373 /DNA_START=334 /DNA_END=855 /DNA_ORIENTATION=-
MKHAEPAEARRNVAGRQRGWKQQPWVCDQGEHAEEPQPHEGQTVGQHQQPHIAYKEKAKLAHIRRHALPSQELELSECSDTRRQVGTHSRQSDEPQECLPEVQRGVRGQAGKLVTVPEEVGHRQANESALCHKLGHALPAIKAAGPLRREDQELDEGLAHGGSDDEVEWGLEV